jgi:hypothetical protein
VRASHQQLLLVRTYNKLNLVAAANRREFGHFVYPTGALETSGRCLMIVLLYIFTLPSPRVSTFALAVQYPCFPHKPRVTGSMTKGSGSGDMNDG